MPLDQAALFSCAVITGVGSVVNTAKVPAVPKAEPAGIF